MDQWYFLTDVCPYSGMLIKMLNYFDQSNRNTTWK